MGALYEHTVAAALVPILSSRGSLSVHMTYPLTSFYYCVLDGLYLPPHGAHVGLPHTSLPTRD